MLSGPTVRWQLSSPVHECSGSAVSVGNWWSCWTCGQGKRCAVSSGSWGYQTQEPCTSVDTGHVWCRCGICPTSAEFGIVALHMVRCHGWGQKWLSVYIKHAYQWSVTKWCRQTDVYHWSSWELALILSQASVWDVAHECYHRACSRWVSQQLSDQQKLNRMAASLTNLQCYKAERTYGLFVMHHNTWMHLFKPQMKMEFMVLKNSTCQHSSSSWELWAWGRYNVLGQSQAHSC